MSQKITFLGKEVRRKKNGQFKRKAKSAAYALAVGAIAAGVAIIYFHPTVMAQIDEMSTEVYTEVTAAVAVDCTSPTHMYEEECVQRVTDNVASTFADLKKAENILQEAQTLYDSAFEAHNEAVEQLNTFTNN